MTAIGRLAQRPRGPRGTRRPPRRRPLPPHPNRDVTPAARRQPQRRPPRPRRRPPRRPHRPRARHRRHLGAVGPLRRLRHTRDSPTPSGADPRVPPARSGSPALSSSSPTVSWPASSWSASPPRQPAPSPLPVRHGRSPTPSPSSPTRPPHTTPRSRRPLPRRHRSPRGPPHQRRPEPPPDEALITVIPGDTAWDLAETHLGDGMRWQELWTLNHTRPQPDGRTWTDPDLLLPGWELALPATTATPAAVTGSGTAITRQPGRHRLGPGRDPPRRRDALAGAVDPKPHPPPTRRPRLV